MTFPLSALLLTLFGISLILTTLSLRLLRGSSQEKEASSPAARFFLVALRLAIGWHCFFEGVEKFKTANWSSEVYLRESSGPLSGFFRSMAGDRLIEKLTLGEGNTFPAELDREWRNYLQAFAAHYELTPEQLERARMILDQREKDTLTYLISKSEEVTKIAPYPPPLKVNMTMKQRLDEYERLQGKVDEPEAKFPTSNKDVLTAWKTAKADLSKWRGELKKSLDAKKDELKKALTSVLTPEQKQFSPMSEQIEVPIASWELLDWADFLVKWSLVVLGVCLMVGLFSRVASLAAALLVLSFYVAMPPLPGWPESPRLEGHYLLINKTLIEVIALLVLACIPTGRWAGIDGILQLFLVRKERSKPLTQEMPASSAAPSPASASVPQTAVASSGEARSSG